MEISSRIVELIMERQN